MFSVAASLIFFFKQKTAYEMRISDWSSDVCSSDLSEAETALRPYLDRGRLKTFDDGEEILPGITAAIHPGHTPVAAFFTVSSGPDAMVFIDDTVHVSAVQLPRPGVTIVSDVIPDQASAVRRQAPDIFADRKRTRR